MNKLELIILVGILAIISAIAIPKIMDQRLDVNEATAKASLRTLYSSEAVWKSSYGKGNYGDLKDLRAANLIDQQMADGEKQGYIFAVGKTDADNGSPAEFVAVASPTVPSGFRATGRYMYMISHDGVLLHCVLPEPGMNFKACGPED